MQNSRFVAITIGILLISAELLVPFSASAATQKKWSSQTRCSSLQEWNKQRFSLPSSQATSKNLKQSIAGAKKSSKNVVSTAKKLSEKEMIALVGMELRQISGYLWVWTVTPGSPAEHAGFVPNDDIRLINGKKADWYSATTALETLYNAPKNGVKVEIGRNKDGGILMLTYLPNIWTTQAPFTLSNTGGIVVLTITDFAKNATFELRENMKKIQWSKVKGMIIDVRQSPQGTLAAFDEVMSMILPQNTPYATLQYNKYSEKISTKGVPIVPQKTPIVVLMNEWGGDVPSSLIAYALKVKRSAQLLSEEGTLGKTDISKYFSFDDSQENPVEYLCADLPDIIMDSVVEKMKQVKRVGAVDTPLQKAKELILTPKY